MGTTQAPSRHVSMQVRILWLLVAFGLLMAATLAFPAGASAQEGGYTYTVQPGDNWTVVAQRVGLTVAELQAANPQAVRPSGWLIVGEKLFIPAPPVQEEQFYTVQPGDGWTTIAAQFGVSTRLLQAVNPRSVRPGLILYVGERLLIPQPAAPATASPATTVPTAAPATPTATASATPQVEAQETPIAPTPSPTATATPTASSTPAPTATPTATSTASPTPTEAPPTPTPSPTPTPNPATQLPPCPEALADAPDPLLDVYNRSTPELDLFGQFLEACGLSAAEPVVQDLTGDGQMDLVL
ncbi:MAG: LysM domain-containing protein, partial [Caldilineae bacterium]